MTDRLEIPEKLSDWEKGGIVEHIGSDEEHTDTFYRHGNLGAEQDKDGTWEAYTIVDGHPIKVKGDMMSFEEVVEFFKGSFCSKKLAGKDEDTHDESPDIDDEPEHPEPDGEMGITLVLKSITEMMSDEYDGCAVMKSKKGGGGINPNERKWDKKWPESGKELFREGADKQTRASASELKETRNPQVREALKKQTGGVQVSNAPNKQYGGFGKTGGLARNMNKAYWKGKNASKINAIDKDGRKYVEGYNGGEGRSVIHAGMSPRQARHAFMMDMAERGYGDQLSRFVYHPSFLDYDAYVERGGDPYLQSTTDNPEVMEKPMVGEYRLLAPQATRFESGHQRTPQVPGTAGRVRYSAGANPGNSDTVKGYLNEHKEMPGIKYNTLDDVFEALNTSQNPDVVALRNHLTRPYFLKYSREAIDTREKELEEARARRDRTQDEFNKLEDGFKIMNHLIGKADLPEGVTPDMVDIADRYRKARSEYEQILDRNKDLDKGRGKLLKGTLSEFKRVYPQKYKQFEREFANLLFDAPFQVQEALFKEQGRDPKYHWIPKPSFFGSGFNYSKEGYSKRNPLDIPELKKQTIDEILEGRELYDEDHRLNPMEQIRFLSTVYPEQFKENKKKVYDTLANSVLSAYPDDFDFTSINDPIKRMIARDHQKSAKAYLDSGEDEPKPFIAKPTDDMLDSIRAYELGGVPVLYRQSPDAKKKQKVAKEGTQAESDIESPRRKLKDDVAKLNRLAIQTGIPHDPSFREAFGELMMKAARKRPISKEELEELEDLKNRVTTEDLSEADLNRLNELKKNEANKNYIPDEDLNRLKEFMYGDDANEGYMKKYGQTFEEAMSKDFKYSSEDEYNEEIERRKDALDKFLKDKALEGEFPENLRTLEKNVTDNLPKYETPFTKLGKEVLANERIDSTSENPLMKSISVMIMEKMSGDLTEPCDQEPNLMPLNEYPRSIIMGAGKVAIPDPQQVIAHDTYRTYPVKNFPENFPGDGE